MTALHLLEEVVRDLEQQIHLLRIKKLIFYVCKGTWENDRSKLDNLNLRNLIEEVCETTVTLQNLKIVLNGIIKKINKPAEYIALTNTIVSTIGKLYPDYEEPKQQVTSLANSPESDRPTEIKQPPTELKKLMAPYDQFDLRLQIMQHANPLRAKLLIFSALDHKFNFTHQDWTIVKKQDLDDLLQNLFYACENAAVLESKLSRTARTLENQEEENFQTASAIVKYMTPLYAAGKKARHQVQVSKKQATEDTKLTTNVAEHIELNDFKNSDPDSEEVAESLEDLATCFPVAPPDDSSNSGNFSSSPSSLPTLPEVTPTPESSHKFSLSALNNLDPIKQKQELQEKVNELVSLRVNSVISLIENTLSELENALDTQLQDQVEEEYLSLKYEALGDFITQLKGTSFQFMELLSRLEKAERQMQIEREVTASYIVNKNDFHNQF